MGKQTAQAKEVYSFVRNWTVANYMKTRQKKFHCIARKSKFCEEPGYQLKADQMPRKFANADIKIFLSIELSPNSIFIWFFKWSKKCCNRPLQLFIVQAYTCYVRKLALMHVNRQRCISTLSKASLAAVRKLQETLRWRKAFYGEDGFDLCDNPLGRKNKLFWLTFS